jgi:hypothetical protein
VLFEDITSVLINANIAKIIEDQSLPPQYPMQFVFTNLVLKKGKLDVTKHPAQEILDFKNREIIVGDDKNKSVAMMSDGLKLFFWKDFPSKKSSYPRYFLVWMSPALKASLQKGERNDIPLSIYFHPFGEIGNNEGRYYKEDNSIDDYYLSIGTHYLLNQHFLLFQHRYAVRDSAHLKAPLFNMPICLVFPIFSGSSHASFPQYDAIHFLDIVEGLVRSAMPKYFAVNIQSTLQLNVGRIAVSAFSLGGILLRRLFAKPKLERLKTVDEVYTFDCVMNDKSTPKQKAYEEFWRNLKVWQGDNSRKLIRFYTAESTSIFNILLELKSNLKKNGGGTLIEGQFKKYDGLTIDNYLYKFPDIDIELHSTDNSRILVLIPMSIFDSYGFGVVNAHGIKLWEGHAWFTNALITHALFHSSF